MSVLSLHALKRQRFRPEQVIAAIRQTRGMVTLAARVLDCEPDTIRNYAKKYASVRAALLEERERVIDVGESALFTATEAGEPWAVTYLLSTIGKHRGYVRREEHTGKDGKPIEVELTLMDIVRQARLASGEGE